MTPSRNQCEVVEITKHTHKFLRGQCQSVELHSITGMCVLVNPSPNFSWWCGGTFCICGVGGLFVSEWTSRDGCVHVGVRARARARACVCV